jgi:hypothetical protein
MVEQTKKLRLEDLKVDSFVTATFSQEEQQQVLGGNTLACYTGPKLCPFTYQSCPSFAVPCPTLIGC